MRILFVTPYPPSRIRARSYGFLTHLRGEHEVTVVAQCGSEREMADVEDLRREGYEIIAVRESNREAAVRSGLALFGSLPIQVAYSRSARFTQAVQHLCSQHAFDVVHVEHIRGLASVEHLAQAHPVIWDTVDCISLLCKHTSAAGPSLPVRMVARLEYKRTQRYEARVLNFLRHVIITSERDRQAMIDLRRAYLHDMQSSDEELGAALKVFPTCIDLEYFRRTQQERRSSNVVFSGKMSYHANVATALFLGRQIMPLIWKTRPETTLTIVGSSPPKDIQLLARDPRIEVTGYVDDIRPYIERAEVVLSPMVYSVGVQFKVLEAMALGTPAVVAAQAAESLKARDGHDLIVAKSAQEFADAALRLMDDVALHAKLVQGGRSYVEQYHDVRMLTERLVEVYQQVIAECSGTSTALDSEASFMSGVSV